MPSHQMTRVHWSWLEYYGLMTRWEGTDDQLVGTCRLFKEWVILLFETNPFKDTVLPEDLQEWTLTSINTQPSEF